MAKIVVRDSADVVNITNAQENCCNSHKRWIFNERKTRYIYGKKINAANGKWKKEDKK